MPIINLTVSGEESPVLAKGLVKSISELTRDLLNKKPEVTVVTLSFTPDHLWFINSESLDELKIKSFHLKIKVTDSTNLKQDKAAYIGAVHRALAEQLGEIHPVSYTAIEEMKADAWGYDGLTQEYRYIGNQNK